jgi:hypothetical protein
MTTTLANILRHVAATTLGCIAVLIYPPAWFYAIAGMKRSK